MPRRNTDFRLSMRERMIYNTLDIAICHNQQLFYLDVHHSMEHPFDSEATLWPQPKGYYFLQLS
jgi:hypothetical protein